MLSPRYLLGGLCLTDAPAIPDCCRWWDDESAAGFAAPPGLALSMGVHMLEDLDPAETREWVDALDSVMAFEGADRAFFLLDEVIEEARRKGAPVPYSATTPYVNTIPPDKEDRLDARELAIDHRIRSLIRWNALAIVLRANKESSELGGHIASFQSAATLYDVGFQHFFHAPDDQHGGDLLFIQGHSSPGIYARSFVEGRLTEDQLKKFRMEVDGGGLASYPHPWLMPEYWQMPTVSMGLGPIMAIYQARFLKYLASRGLADTSRRKVWAFLGDGETDEPESLGAISMASREKLDNLIFVINCNLQRLDGPVRGNGKIIQELEGVFRGAGWNVIKTVWGSGWDPLIARDSTGLLLRRMEECVERRVPGLQVQGRRVRPGEVLRQVPGTGRDGCRHDRRRGMGTQPRRSRPQQDLRRVLGGPAYHRPAHGHPRQDCEGLRDGGVRRGPEHHPPAEAHG